MISENLIKIYNSLLNKEEEDLLDFAVSVVAEDIKDSIRDAMDNVKIIFAETEEDAMIKLALVLTQHPSGETCYHDIDLDEMHEKGVFGQVKYYYCSSVNELYYY